jgi:Flp pilus assembly pilin Flp
MLVKANNSSVKKNLGQGMTEYIIIVAVIAIAAIGAFGAFGEQIERQIGAISQELAGVEATQTLSDAATSANTAATTAAQNNNAMGQYVDNGSGTSAQN